MHNNIIKMRPTQGETSKGIKLPILRSDILALFVSSEGFASIMLRVGTREIKK